MVASIAVSIRKGLSAPVDLEDLIQAGMVGLIEAAGRYSPAKNVPLPCFLRHRIRGAILDSLRDLDGASRYLRGLQKKADSSKRKLLQALDREPTDEELARDLDVTGARWRKLSVDLRWTRTVPLDTFADGRMPASLRVPSNAQPDSLAIRNEMFKRLNLAVLSLPVQCREVIELYYRREWNMRQIGRKMGVSEGRISQIHKMALQQLANQFRA